MTIVQHNNQNGNSEGHDLLRVPPHDLQIEASFLTAMVNGPEIIPKARLKGFDPQQLYSRAHQLIAITILQKEAEAKDVDPLTVLKQLKDDGLLDDIGGPEYFLEMMDTAPDRFGLHWESYLKSIQGDFECREYIRLGEKLKNAAFNRYSDIPDILASFELNTKSAEDRFEIFDAQQLVGGNFDQQFLLPGLLAAGQPTIIAAGKKTLKTNISIDLGVSLASGNPFLGEFEVTEPVPVGIMSGESGFATIQETFIRICNSKDLNPSEVKNFFITPDLPQLVVSSDIYQLKALIEKLGLKVLLIDPAYLSMDIGDGAGNLFTVGKCLQPLSKICSETGCAIIIIHHCRKGKNDPFLPPELEDIACSGFQEWVRQWFLIGRRENYSPENGGHHKLWLNVGGSAGHGGLWGVDINEGTLNDVGGRRWDVEVLAASDARQQAEVFAEEHKDAQVEMTLPP